ncbi:GNAT family N-acetyltransferase [Phenylobacterium aquaticum]|uniref:GNAT family N-acetyltransferase n=1 Tax=Phenylobacterium aquaticum TaxID=1763816 RepID=UPI0026F24C9A|nr:GNAT family protein [Phenylobacterium aquaticum]
MTLLADDTPPWFPLETERLILRDPREEDFDDIHAYAQLDDVVRYMAWGPNTPAMTREVLDRWLSAAGGWPRTEVNLVVEDKAQARVIGSIRLAIQDEVHRTADFGYCFHPDAWGRGIGTEAARAILGAAFGPLNLHRVWATCDVENRGSWGIMEKLGMRREGTFRKHLKPRGAWRDTHLYALLAEEWIG